MLNSFSIQAVAALAIVCAVSGLVLTIGLIADNLAFLGHRRSARVMRMLTVTSYLALGCYGWFIGLMFVLLQAVR